MINVNGDITAYASGSAYLGNRTVTIKDEGNNSSINFGTDPLNVSSNNFNLVFDNLRLTTGSSAVTVAGNSNKVTFGDVTRSSSSLYGEESDDNEVVIEGTTNLRLRC